MSWAGWKWVNPRVGSARQVVANVPSASITDASLPHRSSSDSLHQDQVGVVGDVAGRGPEVDDVAGRRGGVAEGVDVGHHVVAELALVARRPVAKSMSSRWARISVKLLGPDARRLAVVGEQAEFALGLGEPEPEPPPGAELAARAPALGHRPRGVPADERVVVEQVGVGHERVRGLESFFRMSRWTGPATGVRQPGARPPRPAQGEGCFTFSAREPARPADAARPPAVRYRSVDDPRPAGPGPSRRIPHAPSLDSRRGPAGRRCSRPPRASAAAGDPPLPRGFYYPYVYFPHNYWPTYSPQWPEPHGAPYMRPPAYMAYPPFKEPSWRYDLWRRKKYYRGSHFWLDSF